MKRNYRHPAKAVLAASTRALRVNPPATRVMQDKFPTKHPEQPGATAATTTSTKIKIRKHLARIAPLANHLQRQVNKQNVLDALLVISLRTIHSARYVSVESTTTNSPLS